MGLMLGKKHGGPFPGRKADIIPRIRRRKRLSEREMQSHGITTETNTNLQTPPLQPQENYLKKFSSQALPSQLGLSFKLAWCPLPFLPPFSSLL